MGVEEPGPNLQVCRTPLWERYDLALLDLDGVVYIGAAAVPGVDGQLAAAAAAGMHLAYVTNNAARTPQAVAAHLVRLGVPARAEDVVTSAQAAARLLAGLVPAGSNVFVIGGAGLFAALTELGMHPVQSITEAPAAVASGYHPDLLWRTVVQGAILVRDGLPWVASNTDLSVPTEYGPGPGNGVLVDAVARFSGRLPVVAGKPEPTLFEETVRRVGGRRPLVVGDRLDTDIEGANNAGFDSLLVLTGVTGLEELVVAPPQLRPSFVASTLAGLGQAHPSPEQTEAGVELGGWLARVEDGELQVRGAGVADDWWRVVATMAWQHLDRTGRPAGVSLLSPPGSVAGRNPSEEAHA